MPYDRKTIAMLHADAMQSSYDEQVWLVDAIDKAPDVQPADLRIIYKAAKMDLATMCAASGYSMRQMGFDFDIARRTAQKWQEVGWNRAAYNHLFLISVLRILPDHLNPVFLPAGVPLKDPVPLPWRR